MWVQTMAPSKRGVFRQPRRDYPSDLLVSQTQFDQDPPCIVRVHDRSWHSTHNLSQISPTDKSHRKEYWLYRNELVEEDLYKEKIIFLKEIQPYADLSSLVNNTEAQNKVLFNKRARKALEKKVITKQIRENSIRYLVNPSSGKSPSPHIDEFIYKPCPREIRQLATNINIEKPELDHNGRLKNDVTKTLPVYKITTMNTCVGTDYSTTAGTNTEYSRVATIDVSLDTRSSLLTVATKSKNLQTDFANQSMNSDSSTTVAVEFFNQSTLASSESLDSTARPKTKNTRKYRKSSKLPVPQKRSHAFSDRSTSDFTSYSTRRAETDETTTISSRTEQETPNTSKNSSNSSLPSKPDSFKSDQSKNCGRKSVRTGKCVNTKTSGVFKIRPKTSGLYRKKIRKPIRSLGENSEKFATMKKNHSSKIPVSRWKKYLSLPYKSDSHVLTMNPKSSCHTKFWLVAIPNEYKNRKIPIREKIKKTTTADPHQRTAMFKTSDEPLGGILPSNNQDVSENPPTKLATDEYKSEPLKTYICSNQKQNEDGQNMSSSSQPAENFKEQPFSVNVQNNIINAPPHDSRCKLAKNVNEKKVYSTKIRKWMKSNQTDVLKRIKEEFTIGILIHNKHYYLAVDKTTQTPTFQDKIQKTYHTVKSSQVRSAKRSKMSKLKDKETQMYEYLTPSEIYCRDWIRQNLFYIEDLNPHAIILDKKISNDSTRSSMTSTGSTERLCSTEFPIHVSILYRKGVEY